MPPRKTNRNYRTTNRSTTTRRTTKSPTTNTYATNSPKFTPVKQECQWRIGSYRNLYSQFTGAGSKTLFSPTNANKWIKYVNNGVRVYKFNNNEFTKNFGTQFANLTPTSARKGLQKKFGTCIKDVTRGKGNCWLVATTKNPTGRPFNNYNWK